MKNDESIYYVITRESLKQTRKLDSSCFQQKIISFQSHINFSLKIPQIDLIILLDFFQICKYLSIALFFSSERLIQYRICCQQQLELPPTTQYPKNDYYKFYLYFIKNIQYKLFLTYEHKSTASLYGTNMYVSSTLSMVLKEKKKILKQQK
ncbi:hypothetical protein pb186bvf_006020 [Paramecium bursaria]